MSSFKPLHLYGAAGPNPPKVALLLEELSLPYTIDSTGFADIKKPAYLAINPNGRLPAIHDPNTGLTLWESGAIVEYLIEKYDNKHTLSFPAGSDDYFKAKQWLFFQVTGQGPYFGQYIWFMRFAPEKIPLAIARYAAEINRVTDVLEKWLVGQKGESADGPWLVGGKISYADLSFVTWHRVVNTAVPKDEFDVEKYPEVNAWLQKMMKREGVAKALAAADAHMKSGKH